MLRGFSPYYGIQIDRRENPSDRSLQVLHGKKKTFETINPAKLEALWPRYFAFSTPIPLRDIPPNMLATASRESIIIRAGKRRQRPRAATSSPASYSATSPAVLACANSVKTTAIP